MFFATIDGSSSRDIENRIHVAQMKSGGLGRVLSHRSLAPRHQHRLIKAFFLSVVAWASESWEIRQADERALGTWWNKKLRQCLGKSKKEHIRTEVLLGKFGELPLVEYIRKWRLRYYGHVVRYPLERWVRLMLGDPAG